MIFRIALLLGLWVLTTLTAVGGFYFEYQSQRIAKAGEDTLNAMEVLRLKNMPTTWERQLIHSLHTRTTNLSFAEKRTLARVVVQAAVTYSVDPFLLMGLIETESSYRTGAVSNKGAVGLMQLRPFVARAMAVEMGDRGSQVRLTELTTNVRLGSYYLAKLLRRFDGDLSLALEAYNQGPTRVAAKVNAGSRMKWRYAQKVLGARERLKRLGRAA